jgi:hypothetical protein
MSSTAVTCPAHLMTLDLFTPIIHLMKSGHCDGPHYVAISSLVLIPDLEYSKTHHACRLQCNSTSLWPVQHLGTPWHSWFYWLQLVSDNIFILFSSFAFFRWLFPSLTLLPTDIKPVLRVPSSLQNLSHKWHEYHIHNSDTVGPHCFSLNTQ